MEIPKVQVPQYCANWIFFSLNKRLQSVELLPQDFDHEVFLILDKQL